MKTLQILLLFSLLTLTVAAKGYTLNFDNPILHQDLDKDKFACSLKVFRGTEEGHCGTDELGQKADGLKWDEDKLCFKFACTRNPAAKHKHANETKIGMRLQECNLSKNLARGQDMHKTFALITADGCPTWNKAWPTFYLPLNYSRDTISVEAHGWTFNEKIKDSFPEETTLSCKVQICEDTCDQTCLNKISLDHCDRASYSEDKNATELCHEPSPGGNWAFPNGGIASWLFTVPAMLIFAMAFY